MRKSKKSDQQKERDKKGAERMKRFEDGQTEEETPVIKSVDDGEYETVMMTAYQNLNGNGWEKVQIPWKRKKKGR
jgi:hypothetical protein